MECPNCNAIDHEASAKFCHKCGVPLGNDKLKENLQIAEELYENIKPFLKTHDWEKALPNIIESSLLGDSRAQLALCAFLRQRITFNYNHYNGKGVMPLELEDFRLTLSAARLGHPAAQWQVGLDYLYGYISEPDDELAFYWMQKSASNGSPQGMAFLGECYILGIGVSVDKEYGDRLIKEAAEKGSISAKNMLEGYGYPSRQSLDEVRKAYKEEREL